MRDGYRETISNGIQYVRRLSGRVTRGSGTKEEQIRRLKEEITRADAVVIGAGSGLSTAAGMDHGGARFERYFFDFADRYGITDMYSGGFYPFPDQETYWAWIARLVYFNRYFDPEKPVYRELLDLVEGKEYFAITTNVDHLFQKAGIDRSRLFYTQGDYGLFQSTNPSNRKTYDNEAWVMRAMSAQGFVQDEEGRFRVPEDWRLSMKIPAELLPVCPDDGYPFTTNLRVDDRFLEDEGWQKASDAYSDFLRRNAGKHVLFLELGVGNNTPVIIKYPFWQMTADNGNAVFAAVSHDAYVPRELEAQAVCISGDIGEIIHALH